MGNSKHHKLCVYLCVYALHGQISISKQIAVMNKIGIITNYRAK